MCVCVSLFGSGSLQLLATADFDVKKEAAWAIAAATSGGTPEQIRFLVSQQCTRPLCDLLTVQDNRIINVALKGIGNILKLGEEDKDKSGAELNDFCRLVEEADGVDKLETLQVPSLPLSLSLSLSLSDKLETLQSHANDEVLGRATAILKTYFGR